MDPCLQDCPGSDNDPRQETRPARRGRRDEPVVGSLNAFVAGGEDQSRVEGLAVQT